VLRAAGETETTQENIQDWLQPDGDPGFQFLTVEEIAAVIYIFFSSELSTLLNVPFIFLSFFCLLGRNRD
jgi:hypothetical protein